ncbi:MAG: single-stranded-DNA-specific exonuclease RecJ [Clostridia bacterium]|nr:single-stranded-DNA-specific exonuclease RecJ [Clostridia bacterium]
MIKKWIYSKIDSATIDEVAKVNNISKLLAKIMLARGLDTPEKINNFLNPEITELYDPFLFNDMDVAVNTVIDAIENKEKITVYGDYDVDGITSVAVLKSYLLERGADVSHYLPNRLEEGYGLNNEAIDKIVADGTNLLITVDCGISAYEEIEYAKSKGLKVIVTDHHECPAILPEAIAVIDAKRSDSMYPFSSLAGVGVTFKFVQAISKKLDLDRKTYLKYIDIVSLGTIADIVPLVDENRIIVKYGLILMEQTRNVGLHALINASGYANGEPLSSTVISFGLAPRMNAAGRMGKPDLALELLLEKDPPKAMNMALELSETNKTRQNVEKEIIDEIINMVESQKLYEKDVIVVYHEGWHHGVIGIVASKITEMYYKPTILISVENGVGKGSGRSIEGFDLHEAVSECADMLLKFGGHEMAIGLSISEEMIEKFTDKLNEIAESKNIRELQPTLPVEAEITSKEISIDTIKELEALKPYGEGNPMPLFVYRNAKVEGVRLLSNEKHLKLTLKEDSNIFDAIAFNMDNKKYSIKQGDKVDVLHSLEINTFNGIQKVQLNVKDIKKSL